MERDSTHIARAAGALSVPRVVTLFDDDEDVRFRDFVHLEIVALNTQLVVRNFNLKMKRVHALKHWSQTNT